MQVVLLISKKKTRDLILYFYITIEGYKPTINVMYQLGTEVGTQLGKE